MIYRVVMDGNDILNFQEEGYTLISPSLSLELNTAGSFEFTMPPCHEFYDNVKPLASTLSVYEGETLLWFGRPVEIRVDYYKQKTVYCEGALAFFNDSVQRLHEYDRISVHTFFRTVIENHNAQVGVDRQFTVGTITVEDRTVYRKLNYDSTFDVLKRQCIDAEGGYLFLRRENGQNYIDWYVEMPYEGNQPVEFGLNMLDLNSSFDAAPIATCVLPLGDTVEETGLPLTVESVNDGSDVIFSEAVEEYGRVTKAVTFPGVKYASTLYDDGVEYLRDTQFDNLTIECKAAELHWQNDNYGLFRVGQKVHCHSVPHLLDRSFDLLRIELRLDTAEKTIALGTNRRQTLTEITKEAIDGTSSIDEKISDAVSEGLSGVDDRISDRVDEKVEGIDSRFDDVESQLDDAFGYPDVDDFQNDLGGILDDIAGFINSPDYEYGDDPVKDTMLDLINGFRDELDGAGTYSDLSDLSNDIADFLGDYQGYLDSDDYGKWLDDLGNMGDGIDYVIENSDYFPDQIEDIMDEIGDFLEDYPNDDISEELADIMDSLNDADSPEDYQDVLDNLNTLIDDNQDYFSEPNFKNDKEKVISLLESVRAYISKPDFIEQHADDLALPAMLDIINEIRGEVNMATDYDGMKQPITDIAQFLSEFSEYIGTGAGNSNYPNWVTMITELCQTLEGEDWDTAPFEDWTDDIDDLSDEVERYSAGGHSSSGGKSSSSGSGMYSIQSETNKLEKRVKALEDQVAELQEGIKPAHWEHQINGQTLEKGVVNFIT